MIEGLPHWPIEAIPLYAALTLMHQELSGQPANSCVPVCSAIVKALTHLGFHAEIVAAYAAVVRREDQQTVLENVGVIDRPPQVRDDLTTNGHVVIWSPSFKRMADPTIVQAPTLYQEAANDPKSTIPAVLPVSNEKALYGNFLATPKGPYLLTWYLRPAWTHIITDAFANGPIADRFARDGLALAHETLRLLTRMREVGMRNDMNQLHSLYPHLGQLLSGRTSLPPVPDIP